MSIGKPIVVDNSPVPAQAWAGLRQILLVAGGWLLARGYIANDTLEALVVIGGIAIPFIWGQVRTRNDAKAKAVMQPLVSNAVAVSKSEAKARL